MRFVYASGEEVSEDELDDLQKAIVKTSFTLDQLIEALVAIKNGPSMGFVKNKGNLPVIISVEMLDALENNEFGVAPVLDVQEGCFYQTEYVAICDKKEEV